MEPEIIDSARTHDIADEDMLHVWRYAIQIFHEDENLDMLVGAGRSGQMLEVGVVQSMEGRPMIVHADDHREHKFPLGRPARRR